MKQILLILVVTLIGFFSYTGNAHHSLVPFPTEPELAIYPNPATNYFEIKNANQVKQVVIYSMIGSKIKSFKVEAQNHYDIIDLTRGLYLVQFLDENQNIIATRRLSKE